MNKVMGKYLTTIAAVFIVSGCEQQSTENVENIGAGQISPDSLTVDNSLIPTNVADTAVRLREDALQDNLSIDIVESLTTEVGARRMGTEGDQRVIAWAQEKMQELGFDRVWIEPVELERGWIRGEAEAEILSPYPHPLVLTALGYSVGTPEGGITAEVVEFKNFDELLAIPPGDSLAGRIAFISYNMNDYEASPNGSGMSGYREGTRARSTGHLEAARRGASAIIIRSVGTDNHRYAHTGSGYGYEEGVAKIPAAALSAPDAILLQNVIKRGQPVTVKLTMTSQITGPVMGANVIGEITGRENPDEYVVLGAHIDSWDEGTGALDDGAGIASMMATAAFIGRLEERPRRSIRVLLFAGEEIGFIGVREFMAQHGHEMDKYWLGAEVDGGGGGINKITSGVGDQALAIAREMYKLVAPLGIEWSDDNNASAASDMSLLSEAGMPAFDLSQNPNDYFMYHHTPNDTFDKIIPEEMRQLTATYSVIAYLSAELDVDFRR